MPEGSEAVHHGGSGIAKLLQAQTAGLPNWAWLLIIAGGIAAAIIVPNLLGGGATTTPATTDNTGDTTGAGTTPDLSSLLGGAGAGGGYDYSSPAATPATATTSALPPTTGQNVTLGSLPLAPMGTYQEIGTVQGGPLNGNLQFEVVGAGSPYPIGTIITLASILPTTPTTPTSTPAPAPAPTQLQTQNAMQQQAQTPPTTVPSGTPLSNLQKIVNYLASLGTGATVSQVGTPGTPQSGYVITGNNVNAGALGALFGGGWSVTKCGTNKYLVKGPGATNVVFGPNCVVTGYD